MKIEKIVEKIVEKLEAGSNAYYNTGKTTMSDSDYDSLRDQLEKLDPKNEYLKKVGAETKGNIKQKYTHVNKMLSLGKAKDVSEMNKWLEKIGAENEEMICCGKIDGMSGCIIYKNGKLDKIVSRGNGEIGQIISHIASHINIPKTISLKGDVEIRGEIYLPKDTKLETNGSPLRNLAVGIIGRVHSDVNEIKFLKFICYQILGSDFKKESQKLDWLKKNGFETVDYEVVIGSKAIEDYFNRYNSSFRSAWKFESDGIVLTVSDNSKWDGINSKYEISHHFYHNLAWKPVSEEKESTLKDIQWSISRQGKAVPVAIVEPVVFNGRTVTRATLNNVTNVRQLKLSKGDKVIIKLANEVIPFFSSNLTNHKETSKELIPLKCNSCGTKLIENGVHLVCSNKDCKEQNVLMIIHWVVNSGIEQFSESSVRSLYDAGKIKSVVDLYSLEEKDFKVLEGFGNKKISNALSEIERTKEMSLGQFVDKLSIEGVGEKFVKKIGIKTVEEFLNFKNAEGYEYGKNIIEYVKENKDYINQLLSFVKIKKEKEVKVNANAKHIAVTGTAPMKRDDVIIEIQKRGDVYDDGIRSTTTVLLCEDIKGSSSKLIKAKAKGIKLLSYSDYLK